MKEGILVFNHSYVSSAVLDHITAFVSAFERLGIRLTPTDGLRLSFDGEGNTRILGADFDRVSFAVFWDKDIFMARALEAVGVRVYNSASALETCDDKLKTYQALAGLGIAFPRTVHPPLVYEAFRNVDDSFTAFVIETLGFPMVVKENRGSLGAQVHLAQTRAQLLSLRRRLLHRDHIYQEFVGTAAGADYRYYYADGGVIACCKRENRTDFRSNVEVGGIITQENDLPFKQEAETAARAVGLSFGAVDFLKGKDGVPVFCEINTNAFFLSLKRLSGVDMSEFIADEIAREMPL